MVSLMAPVVFGRNGENHDSVCGVPLAIFGGATAIAFLTATTLTGLSAVSEKKVVTESWLLERVASHGHRMVSPGMTRHPPKQLISLVGHR